MATSSSEPKLRARHAGLHSSGEWQPTTIGATTRSRIGDVVASPCRMPGGGILRAALVALIVLLLPGATPKAEDNYRSVGGLAIYLGVLPAQLVQGHSEMRMHGGVPRGQHQHHILVAVFDATSGARVTDAEVNVTISRLPHEDTSRRLETMSIGDTVTYGQYFELRDAGRYTIRVEVKRAGQATPVTTQFVYEHDLRRSP